MPDGVETVDLQRFNDERGGKRSLTQWMYLYTEPSAIESATGPMAKAFGMTLGIELLLVGWIAWRFGRKKTTETLAAAARADA